MINLIINLGGVGCETGFLLITSSSFSLPVETCQLPLQHQCCLPFVCPFYINNPSSVSRLRALSGGSGSSGGGGSSNPVASPPLSPVLPKYKLADYRYGREEMLALYVKDNKVGTTSLLYSCNRHDMHTNYETAEIRFTSPLFGVS